MVTKKTTTTALKNYFSQRTMFPPLVTSAGPRKILSCQWGINPQTSILYIWGSSPQKGLDILVCCLTILKDFKASLLQNTMLWTFPHQLSRSSSLYNCSLSFELTLSAVISLCRVFPISRKVGLASGSCCQHCHMMAYLQQREHLLSKY